MKRWILLCLFVFLAGTAFAQDYVGDTTCGTCHANFPETGFFDNYMNSGHPWKLTYIGGDTPASDLYPWTPLPPLPDTGGVPLQWDDVEYIIGNYFWKARFVGVEGYIVTGGEDDSTQFNLATQGWVPYHPGEVRQYDCGRCHTTGYDADATNDLPGIAGDWAQPGVRCEACHGPGSEHAADPSNVSTPGGIDCIGCHYRDSEYRMPWSGGFMRHHQQGEEFVHSPHGDVLSCTTCHNPHRSTVYNDGGLVDGFSCSNCHPGSESNGYYVIQDMEDLNCVDCHMPDIGKSAVASGPHSGDVAGHLFEPMTDPVLAEDNVTDIGGTLYWNQDDDGRAYITLDYACLGCHTEDDEDIDWAATNATDIHTARAAVGDAASTPALPGGFEISAVYPNPFNSSTTITFRLDKPYIAKVAVFDALGRQVATLRNGPAQAGEHKISFDGADLSSGIYFVRLTTGAGSTMAKMILLK